MELVALKIKNFKRFAGDNKVVLDGKLVAIVGPNEAGKTSLLRALQHFNHSNPFETSGASQEITRDVEVSANDRVIEATYWVTEQDRIGLEDVPESKCVRWVTISKYVSSDKFSVGQYPRPKRDLSRRHRLAQDIGSKRDSLKGLLDSYRTPSPDDESQLERDDPVLNVDDVVAVLESDAEKLTESELETLALFESELAGSTSEHDSHAELCESIRQIAEYQKDKHPEEKSRTHFYKREPKFLLFSDEDRMLESEYNLELFFRAKDARGIPAALRNLVTAARLELRKLYDAAKIGDHGEIDSLTDNANAELESLLTTNWSQSKVSARLRLDGTTLHVLAGFRGSKFVRIAERSDGLRQYIALLAFLSRQPASNVPPILLIDEAETHLHYDAQADLVQMLAKQTVAAKVIYTTHSVGCLPEDLGQGIRMVKTSKNHSTFENWFWESDTPGFSPLLFALGASTLAFVPIRNALLTEGASDILLLPTLLRDAADVASLQFQIAPGLSKSHPDRISVVDSQSPSTAYLVDRDEGGDAIKRKLHRAGIDESHIVSLPDIDGEPATIEDFIDRRSLAEAVNNELRRSHDNPPLITDNEILSPGAIKSIEDWCKSKQLPSPKKRAIAYQLLENQYEHPVLAEKHKGLINELYQDISRILDLNVG